MQQPELKRSVSDLQREEEARAIIETDKKNMPRPLVICGPSGVGKGTLLKSLQADFPSMFARSISHTTRAPRPGEVNGVHYHFVSMDEMKTAIAARKFVEHAIVHGKIYGTSIASVHAVAQTGKICILEVDIQGAESVRHLNPFYIFIHPPSVETLRERLSGRGTETEETMNVRLQTALHELKRFKEVDFFHHSIVNDDYKKAYDDLKTCIFACYPHLQNAPKQPTDSNDPALSRSPPATPTAHAKSTAPNNPPK